MIRIKFVIIKIVVVSNLFSQDNLNNEGWTTFPENPDSRIIYVSSSLGDDENNGYSKSTPVATLEKGASLIRNGFPDKLLLKRGDEWIGASLGRFKRGRKKDEPIIISWYGDTGPRPLIKLTNSFLSHSTNDKGYDIAIIGLDFWAYKHDPLSPEFNSKKRVVGINLLGGGENILFEDCIFRHSMVAIDGNNGRYKNITFRRCIIADSWADSSYFVHTQESRAQGLYISNTDNILVEECVFDHNGWNEIVDGAGANMFNHNLYMQSNNTGTITRNNIIARGAAHGMQHRSGGICVDNLFVRNAIGVNFGHNLDPGICINNCIIEGRLMDPQNSDYPRTSAIYGITVTNDPAFIGNNIIANRVDDFSNRALNDGDQIYLKNNIVYNWDKEWDMFNPGWLDPNRNVSKYCNYLGKSPSLDTFLYIVRSRPINTWWTEYSAKSVNAFISEGFSKDVVKSPPLAEFDYEFLPDVTSNTLSFEVKPSNDLNNSNCFHFWDFGDGVSDTGRLVIHNFEKHGSYRVILVSSNDIRSEYSIKDVNVGFGNNPPFVQFTSSLDSGIAPLQVTFDASGSYDMDGDSLQYLWDFDDNKTDTGNIVTHKYSRAGHYLVTLTIFDSLGAKNRIRKNVSVLYNNPPTASFTYQQINGTLLFSFDAANSSDPEGNPLTYYWNYGDFSPLDTSSGKYSNHQFSKSGVYNVILSVSDGATKTSLYEQIIVNQKPIPFFTYYIDNNNNIINVDASESYDPDGDQLIYKWEIETSNKTDTFEGINIQYLYGSENLKSITLFVSDKYDCAELTKEINFETSDSINKGEKFNIDMLILNKMIIIHNFQYHKNLNYEILDLKGTVLKQGILVEEPTLIGVPELVPGIYIFRLGNKYQLEMKKIIIN